MAAVTDKDERERLDEFFWLKNTTVHADTVLKLLELYTQKLELTKQYKGLLNKIADLNRQTAEFLKDNKKALEELDLLTDKSPDASRHVKGNEKYEDERISVDLTRTSPVELVKFLVEVNGLPDAQLQTYPFLSFVNFDRNSDKIESDIENLGRDPRRYYVISERKVASMLMYAADKDTQELRSRYLKQGILRKDSTVTIRKIPPTKNGEQSADTA